MNECEILSSGVNNMKITVATPVFNAMPWLPCCLASVRDQAAEGVEFEHILHDGGSTDCGLEVLASAPGIQWSTGPDEGMYDAINRCWKQATGGICCYLNADEQYLPGTLARVAARFAAEPELEMLLGDALLVNQQGGILSYRRVVAPTVSHTRLVHLSSMSCATFFRRHLLEEDFYFDIRWKAIGDAEWMVRLLERGLRIATMHEPLAAFGVTGSNLGANPRALQEADTWRRQMGFVPPGAPMFIRGWHWLKKAATGAYGRHDVDTALYLPGRTDRRMPVKQAGVGHRWVDFSETTDD